VPLVVRSSWGEGPGTLLTSNRRQPLGHGGLELTKPVDGAELESNQALIALAHVPDSPGVAAQLFEALGSAGLNVDLIVQATHEGSTNDIAFTLAADQLDRAQLVCREVLAALGADPEQGGAQLSAESGLAKLSISGAGILGRPGVAARLFDTLAKSGINLRLIATSEVKVSCLVAGHQGQKALRAAAEVFELGENQLRHNPAPSQLGEPAVRGVALDRDQAQVAVRRLPDRPGTAAAVCRAMADAQISLDAIVQSERTHGSGEQLSRDMSFTLRKEDLGRAEVALKALLKQWPGARFEQGAAIARISAVGAGMPCTPGTAAKMFRALAAEKINIELIATSEIRTSCVVPEADGVRALQAVHAAFGLGGEIQHQAKGSESPLEQTA
ncbi:ACT domain-containing protein, partial [Cyanobium sp. HWJ4-Hawea]|uniref:ACT domain-containing protein n=1 Tax=Cyanobium sp. HWJ4-Hawea TaxID=2823713 RepID=UPI0020CE44DD